ncbi:MAG: hypothetical protein K2H25_05280 [Alistipes sp.]|nr:hypothetical protein [Alistipes sp.]MDE6570316.1 hypothetical protein [Alistipes sp.]
MKKIFSFAIVVAAVAMIGCCGNTNKKAEAEAQAQTECANCENAEGCEKTDSCCCCEKAAAEEAAK